MDIKQIMQRISSAFSSNPIVTVLTIITLFLVFYYSISVLQRNNAKWVIFVFVAYVLVTGVAFAALDKKTDAERLSYLLVPMLFIVAETALFATEVKRDIWETFSKKTVETHRVDKSGSSTKDVDVCIEEIIKALQNMSKNDVGALIILGNGNLPKTVIDSGVVIDSDISSA